MRLRAVNFNSIHLMLPLVSNLATKKESPGPEEAKEQKSKSSAEHVEEDAADDG